MRLAGVGLSPLTTDAETAFELVTEDFYRNAYRSSRRRLQFVESFDTDVKVIGDRVDSTGITITYDQSLRFTADRGSLDEISASDILLVPLSGKELQQIYLQALKTGNEVFGGVTAVNTPLLPEPSFTLEKGSNGIDSLLLIFIIIGGVFLCGSCFIAVVLVRRCIGNGGDPVLGGGEHGEKENNFDHDYMYDNPNSRMNHLNDPFIDEIGQTPDKHDRSDSSADEFFLDPSENVGADVDGRGDIFDDEIERNIEEYGDCRRGHEDRALGLGGITRRHQGRTDGDGSSGSDSDSMSGSSSSLGSTDEYNDSDSESGSGSYSGSDSSSSGERNSFQGSEQSMSTSALDIA